MQTLLNQKEFLGKYRVNEDEFNATGLLWNDLETLFLHYLDIKPDLESIGQTMSNRLMKIKKVHSVRYRIKDEEHLIEKIIRKRIEKPDRIIDIKNYTTEITDLVGLRAIHLFKEDWKPIHDVIDQTWNLKETAKAYIREGDNEVYRQAFTDQGLSVEVHKRGYRSIHYITITKPAKIEFFTEIQVRTIFEEGWSEIDHSVRYPYELDNLLYKEFSSILNRLAGMSDEMGTFINLLRAEITANKEKILSNQQEIERLQAILDKPEITQEDKNEIKEVIKYVTLPGYYPKISELAKGLEGIKGFPGLPNNSTLGKLAELGKIPGISAGTLEAMRSMTDSLAGFNSITEAIKANTQIYSGTPLNRSSAKVETLSRPKVKSPKKGNTSEDNLPAE
ncbi:RelA/SpoT domain-containing protein [Spirosoma foliorum]|uniref:RelA/SpoT domain-containing protein n=1 Tax=Spirosoma foliorum TaxID=2710596 RepID=A0A7G5H5H0_9BACT|nr:hypothetical protein [Spirosoma foliorum]QMW06362.1 hypothetical protein H3H32_16460 [Spirosoma foliorum]